MYLTWRAGAWKRPRQLITVYMKKDKATKCADALMDLLHEVCRPTHLPLVGDFLLRGRRGISGQVAFFLPS